VNRLDKEVHAHTQEEHMDYEEIRPSHINRKNASQTVFDHAKKELTELFVGKRCCVCEFRGEKFQELHEDNQIESHHMFEWSYQNADNIKKVELILRLLSPLMHGIYLMTEDEILSGKLVTLWDHEHYKNKPLTSYDDARNQWFLCKFHHQQSTKQALEDGIDIIGLHHIPFPDWLQYFVMPTGVFPVKHASPHHEDGLDRTV
jgi:hypothetical protein